MTEQRTDRYGAEYKRTDNDFHVRYLEQDNCICSVCHGTGAKIEIRYVVRNYESARVKNKICKNLQAHERSLWICPKCINNFKQKLSVINERNLTQPEPKWIPCSERLPKKEYKEQRSGTYLTTNGYGVVCMMNYEFEGDFGFVGWGTNRPSDIQIVAWMPLPEPYTKRREK